MSNIAHTIHRLSIDNLNDVAKLHTAVYGKIPPFDFFLKYDTAFTGVEHIGFIAYDKDMPIAFYGVIPCFMKIGGKIILAAQSADTMTRAGYRKKGLFAELATKTYELCQNQGIHLVFGFPNQNSLPGFINTLKWHMKDTMDCFIIPVNTIPLEKLSFRFPSLKNLYARYKQWVLKGHVLNRKGVSSSVIANKFDGVFRDDDYLQYKTYTATQVINIKGVKVWVKMNNGIMIGDMTGITAANFERTMKKLIKLTRMLGVRQLQFHASPGTELHTLFVGRYWAIPSFPVIFKSIGETISPNKIKFTFADIDIF
jgi:hypothetical protein